MRHARLEAIDTSVLGIAIVRVRVRRPVIIANEIDLLTISTPGTNRLVLPSSPSTDAREDERNEQHTTGRGQGYNRDEQILLLSLEIIETLGI